MKRLLAILLFIFIAASGAQALSALGNIAVSLTVLESAPFISRIVPSSGANTGITNIVISGSGFLGATSVTIAGVPVQSYTIVNDGQINAVVQSGLVPGIKDVKVTNSIGTSPDNHPYDQFTVTSGGGNQPPTITGIYPSSGANTGVTYVAIIGTNFTGTRSVSIEGINVQQWRVISDTQINAVIQAGLSTGIKNMKVRNGVGTSADNHPADQFTVTSGGGTIAPSITSVVPNSGPDNAPTPIIINGSNFTGAATVRIGTLSIPFQVLTDSQMSATVPAGVIPGPYHITVSNQVGTSPTTPADIFTVIYTGSGPFVTQVNPSSGPNTNSTTVVISGFNFTGATSVTIGGAAVQSFTVNSATQITAVIQSGITPAIYHVRVTTPVSQSPETPADEFTVTNGGGSVTPAITGINPNNGSNLQNIPAVISGSNFTGATSVQIGTLQVPFSVVNDGEIQIIVPSGLPIGVYNVTVTNPAGTSNAVPYTVTSGNPGPQIWYIQPSSGSRTSTTNVAIYGINFTGASAVLIGAVPVQSFTFVNDGQINAVIQSGLTAGDYHLQVTTPVATSSKVPADIFTVTSGGGTAIPTVTAVNPNSGSNLYEVPIIITGTNFTGTVGVNLNAINSTFEVISDTEIRALVPAGLPLGTYNVKVTNAIGTSPDNHPNDQYTVTGTGGGTPTVTGVVPNSGANTSTTPVAIYGTNLTGATAINIGSTPITTFTVVNNGQINATVPAGINPNIYHITVTTPLGTSAQNPGDQFTVTSGGGNQPPTITGIYPSSGANTGVTYVAIIGTNFTGTRSVSIEGINVQQWQVITDGQINATIQAGLSTGIKNMKVRNGVGTSADNHPADQFTVTSGGGTVAPSITSVVPNSGPDNAPTPIIINGSNFTGTAAVRIGTLSIPFQVLTDSQMSATVPAGIIPGPYHITATNQVGTSPTSPADIFTVTYSGSGPFVTSVVPASGPNSSTTPVVISGFNFTGATAVSIGGAAVQSFTFVNTNQINAVIQSGITPAIYHVRVTTPVSQSPETPADEFTVTSGGGNVAPTIASITPNTSSNLQNTPVVISGSNFTGVTDVKIGGISIPFSVINNGEIQATVPSGLTPGVYNITASNPAGTSNGVPFTVTSAGPGPQVWYLNPQSGVNTSTTNVAITGTDFTGATAVSIGGVPVQSFSVLNNGSINAVIQAGITPGIYHVQVTSPIGTSPAVDADRFTVTSGGATGIPTVTAVNPNSGSNLYEVPIVISGTNFTGAVAVTLNAVSATYEVISNTEIRALVPAGLALGTYNVKVTNAIGTSPDNHPNDQYTVTGNINNGPTVTGVSPNTGPNNTPTTVSIGGTNLTGATAVTIGGTPVQSFSVISPTEISAVIQSGIQPGLYDLRVTTPSGTSPVNPADHFTVTQGGPVPVVTGINPSSGQNNLTTPIVISGTNLENPTGVMIGNLPITFTPVSGSQVNATVPAGIIPGVYPITVTTPFGTSIPGPNSQFTVLPQSGAPATPEGMTMTKNGSDLTLGWTISSTLNVDHYNIYRNTSPNFVPSVLDRVGTSTTPNYTDAGALTASSSYYYRVTAQSASGAESMTSNIGYKLNKLLTFHTNISNINWISIPYRTPYTNANDIAQDIPNATKVSRFNPSTQLYEHWQKFLGSWIGTNFAVTAGESYLVVVNADSNSRLVGWHDRNTVIGMTFHTTISNINWTSVPYHSVYTNANDIVQSVGANATKISRWNASTQNYESWQKFLGNWTGVNFAVTPGEGYAVIINADTTWKPTTNN